MTKIKMYCIFAQESLDKIKGVRGKMASMAGHGYLHAFWDAEKRYPRLAKAYFETDHAWFPGRAPHGPAGSLYCLIEYSYGLRKQGLLLGNASEQD